MRWFWKKQIFSLLHNESGGVLEGVEGTFISSSSRGGQTIILTESQIAGLSLTDRLLLDFLVPMPQISDPAIVCAENIAISSLFHNIPVPPSLNTVGRAPPDKGKYTFSFDRERKLAGTLAFLAHIKDGADHIPAVCIEEDPNSASLNVILAVNKAKAHDGDEVIRRIQQGFDGIFTILGRLPVGE